MKKPDPKFKPDRIHNPSLTEREKALQALAKMKELEKERKPKMITIQADPRTQFSSTKKRAARLAVEYLENKMN